MLKHWNERQLPELLAEHGLGEVPEEPFPNDGWSGAQLTLLRRGKDRFILKRTSWARDWIARATDDRDLREGFVASNAVLRAGPVVAPYLGAAADDASLTLLMPDLSNELIAWERPSHEPGIDVPTLDRVVDSMARLHFMPWARHGTGETWPWCRWEERLLLLTRRSAERYQADGVAAGSRFLEGWDAFERCAPIEARSLIDSLSTDVAPLIAALGRLPSVGLHGDLKLANVALLPGDRVALIDWQMMIRAPVAVELGWFLVSNVQVLPEPPEVTLGRYLESARWHSDRWGGGPDEPTRRTVNAVLGDWEAQVDLTWIVGLLLRGWRKGLDAGDGVQRPSGVSAADDLEWWCRAAVEAADRRL